VDNRYTQTDIQELAKCFTGWSLCKVAGNLVPTFPQSALAPPQVCGVSYDDTVLIAAGAGWRYFKGSAEPSPAPGDGSPTTGWAAPGFNDSEWVAGSTGIGYGDGDDATILSDMQNQYMSVYLRRTFTVADPAALANLVLEASYDDGFVAYLNGIEVARSKGMTDTGTPPAHDVPCMESHEATLGAETFSLNASRGLLMPGVNVLAIQVHNTSLNSGDLSMIPRLLDRAVRPDSVENGDPSGIWTFHFDPDRHDTTAKTLFKGTPNEIKVPAGRTGMAGLSDAIDVVQALARHPSAAEFISIKLIQKFVSDEISLAALRSNTVPDDLKALLADAIGAWNSTSPPGNIRTVLEAILDPAGQTGPFWSDRSYRAKVKNPIEFINSSIRAFEGSATGKDLPGRINAMGMDLFTRDDPDGWPEIGVRWIDTATLLARINFGQAFAENHDSEFVWTSGPYLSQRGLDSAGKIVDYFDSLLFQGTLPAGRREALIGFLTTDVAGQPLVLSPARADFDVRVEEFVGLLLSLPEWHYQ